MESLGGDRHGRQAGKKTKMDRHIDRQAGGQPVKHMDRKAGFGTSRLGRLEERQKMDRQTGRRAVSQSVSQTIGQKEGVGTGRA